jgi:energy-coupling factor transport system permease protein
MRPALAYTPRPGRLQAAAAPAALAYLGSFVLVAFLYSNPVVLAGAGAAVIAVGFAAGAGRALAQALRWGIALGLFVIAVNGLVTHRGDTVLIRGFEVPVLGAMDVTLESLAAGTVLALRILVVMLAFAVYSACVDPDRVLRLVRPVAGRSALTATLIARLVPVAAADHARLREAAELRGPGASPAGRAALARRLVAGSLDRAVDVAATLELRGYGLPGGRSGRDPGRRSVYDGRFLATGVGIAAFALAARIAGVGAFDAYPELAIEADPATVGLAIALPIASTLPFARFGRPAGRPAPTPEVAR